MKRDLSELLLRILALRHGVEDKQAFFNVILPEITLTFGAERSAILLWNGDDAAWREIARCPNDAPLRWVGLCRLELPYPASLEPVVFRDGAATQLLLPWKTWATQTCVLCLRWEDNPPPEWIHEKEEVASFSARLGNYLGWEQVLLQIASAKRDLQSIFDRLPSPVCLIRSDHTIERINNAFTESFNVSYEDAVGKKCYQVIHQMEGPPAECCLSQVLDLNTEMTAKMDEERGLYVTLIPYRIEGSDARVMEIFKRKNNTASSVKSLPSYQLFKLYDLISQPLTSVSITSQLLKEDPCSPNNARRIDILCSEVKRMIDILKDGWEHLRALMTEERFR